MQEMIQDLKKMYGWTDTQAREYLYKIGYQHNPWISQDERDQYEPEYV